MEVFGKYVMGVHGKDGKYPTNGMHLGAEVPLGQGKVDFPKLIAQLREAGYDGAITIEREISGPQQIEDIKMAKAYLETLLAR
jgi:sugar phosphate isomerase/epimerase